MTANTFYIPRIVIFIQFLKNIRYTVSSSLPAELFNDVTELIATRESQHPPQKVFTCYQESITVGRSHVIGNCSLSSPSGENTRMSQIAFYLTSTLFFCEPSNEIALFQFFFLIVCFMFSIIAEMCFMTKFKKIFTFVVDRSSAFEISTSLLVYLFFK